MDKPLRILAVVNVPWDPRLGAARVWIELTDEWRKAGHEVEKYCLTDAFPEPASSPAQAALRLIGFRRRAAIFIRENATRFDVIDVLIGTLPYSKKALAFHGLFVARSVGLYQLYDRFERTAAKRWPATEKRKPFGRAFYWFFFLRAHVASRATVRHCDLLNLPNRDELTCIRDEVDAAKPAIVQPYGLRPERRDALAAAAPPLEARWRKKQIAFIGMWSPRKGSRDWAAIVRQIRARVPEARFLFLGTMIGSDKVWKDLEMEPTDFIEIVPQFDPDQLPRLLADCAAGAFPSYVEGFGMAVVELLAAGLPTTAYDVPGPRDILTGDLAKWLMPPGDAKAFSEVIASFLTGDLAAYRDLSAKSIQAAHQFSWPEIARETAAEYRTHLDHVRA